MKKQEFLALAENAYDSYELKPESIFMFKLFQFAFEYNDEEKTCTVSAPVTDYMYNPSGIVHGGILAFIADTAMGHLNFRYKKVQYVTLELKTSYFKAVSSGKLMATARYIKDGYNVCFIECDVRNEKGDLLSRTNGTFYRYEKKNT
ncbi:PaaI family thioesterase [Caldibacillus thermolactis]|uniref:PaaI family thioesterase n=1 Tax=Pallidibacillus thermolactis TaxID=251051 RepID=A0ABT2WDM8_9BACI|nr:PaaI family thioesterase [Pallidibacillus thermolactis]MCU9593768.1 PaaI family thioesterase [Pallidibacillus thermolactis]MCU9601302.1 PaaI family thioesterase [Pallidibacillus thermolactis subsp. kokeshiiformis]MED1674167.1 PaaI family thioesterase [Pallidibacillus thermolactis subsp. kokeshiiformis]